MALGGPLAGDGDGAFNDGLMPEMQAVEISDRVDRAFSNPGGGRVGSVASTKPLVIASCRSLGFDRPVPASRERANCLAS